MLIIINENISKNYLINGYFYNPNIFPPEEYEKRMNSLIIFRRYINFELFIGNYANKKWLDYIKGFESEKEGGKRCELCIRFRLESSACIAKSKKIKLFATTLSISPHKNADMINTIGREIALKNNLCFLEKDFKEKGGFAKSVEISKKLNLYRQKYCGCNF